MRFRVLCDRPSSQYVDILVPGYGHCWVERSEALMYETTSLTRWTLDQHSIRSMALGLHWVDDAEKTSVCELLELVGRPIRSLRLTMWAYAGHAFGGRDFLNTEFLVSVVRSCPQLEILRLCGRAMVRAQVLVGLYEHHPCHIKTLDLSFVDAACICSLLEALANPTSRIARTLEELCLRLGGRRVVSPEASLKHVRAAFGMLQTNRCLRTIALYVSEDALRRFRPQFQALMENMSPTTKALLPVASKGALLSVLRHTEIGERGVIASIIEFAGACEPRTVYISARRNNLY